MSKEMTAEEYLKNATYNNVERFGDAVTPESCESYGDLRAKEALKSIEEKQKRQDEQYAIMAREYEFALNEVIRLQNIVDTGNKEAVKEFAKWFRAFMLSQGLIGCADILLAYAKQKGVEI